MPLVEKWQQGNHPTHSKLQLSHKFFTDLRSYPALITISYTNVDCFELQAWASPELNTFPQHRAIIPQVLKLRDD
jgi:hypothetical protein